MTVRTGILGATALVFGAATWLWVKNGAAILLDLSWTGCF